MAQRVQPEIWEDHIIGNLFKDNLFALRSVDMSPNVLAGRVVHIPQAGAKATVKKNRTVLPATVTKRSDTDITYVIEEFTTDPVLIPNAAQYELSYDLRASVLLEHEMSLRDTVFDNLLFDWAPAGASNIIRTTGETVDSHLDWTTGSRCRFKAKDLKNAQRLMNRWGLPLSDRIALFDADLLDQFTDDLTVTEKRDFSDAYNAAEGIVGRLYGFEIMLRKDVLNYTNDAIPAVNALDAAGASTDNATVLCWHNSAVERAMGEKKFFEQLDAPQYYGDVYSFLMRMGGRKRRADSIGVIGIVQGTPSAN